MWIRNPSTIRVMVCASVGLAALILVSCGDKRQQVKTGPQGPAHSEPAKPQPVEPTKPDDVAIGDLTPDPARTVRVKGVLSSIVGMRLVPPKLIFKITDNSGTVLAVINERLQLSEGTNLELVGQYRSIPSPMHTGPGEAPEEAVFVVERYLDLP